MKRHEFSNLTVRWPWGSASDNGHVSQIKEVVSLQARGQIRTSPLLWQTDKRVGQPQRPHSQLPTMACMHTPPRRLHSWLPTMACTHRWEWLSRGQLFRTVCFLLLNTINLPQAVHIIGNRRKGNFRRGRYPAAACA